MSDAIDISSPRPCTRCAGAGVTHSQWAKDNGYEGPEGRPCRPCKGTGSFAGLDPKAIVAALFGRNGFRKSFPAKLDHYGTVEGGRAYYVWRLARFHGGADVRMPCTADMVTGGDPFKKELDLLAYHVARKVFGTDRAAAYRWGTAMGYDMGPAPKGLPPTALPGGPEFLV